VCTAQQNQVRQKTEWQRRDCRLVWKLRTGDQNNHNLLICLRLEDSLDRLGGTFREEGLSVGFSALRIQGESIEMTIDPVRIYISMVNLNLIW
jgi:hypothetical protein